MHTLTDICKLTDPEKKNTNQIQVNGSVSMPFKMKTNSRREKKNCALQEMEQRKAISYKKHKQIFLKKKINMMKNRLASRA